MLLKLEGWAVKAKQLEFTHSGRQVENGYIKSFNGRLRDKCLNLRVFFTLEDVRGKLDA